MESRFFRFYENKNTPGEGAYINCYRDGSYANSETEEYAKYYEDSPEYKPYVIVKRVDNKYIPQKRI